MTRNFVAYVNIKFKCTIVKKLICNWRWHEDVETCFVKLTTVVSLLKVRNILANRNVRNIPPTLSLLLLLQWENKAAKLVATWFETYTQNNRTKSTTSFQNVESLRLSSKVELRMHMEWKTFYLSNVDNWNWLARMYACN